MTGVLDGTKVLVTRPKHQAKTLCELIENFGGTVIRLPVIEIRPNKNKKTTKMVLDNISQYDIGIFISRNSVEWTIKLLAENVSYLDKLSLISIGAKTTETLKKFSFARIVTNSGTNSESLLDLDVLDAEKICNKKIIIFRGEGGREHLATTLKKRGAKVDYAEIYRRECPEYDKGMMDKLWASNSPDVIIVTSNNALENLFSLLNKKQLDLALTKQLVVIGERMLDFSIEFGFRKTPILTEESSDKSILNAIVKWAVSKNGSKR